MIPVPLPTGGILGWRLLERTLDRQLDLVASAPSTDRLATAFRERIGDVRTADDLVNDRQLLTVALGAFGLSDDINARALVRRVLEEGTGTSDALANRLADRRYRDLAAAFAFDAPAGPNTGLPGFADRMLDRFFRSELEVSVGEVDPDLRIALNAQEELAALAARDITDETAWLTVLGTPPLRQLMETALGLPSGVATLDLDRQVEEFRGRADATFGTSRLAEIGGENLGRAIDLFLLRSSIQAGPPTSPALVLLRGF